MNNQKTHDMGGMPDKTAVIDASSLDNGSPVFQEKWHARALALTLAAGALGEWNLDASRYERECLPSDDYLQFSYYEKWLAGVCNLLVKHDLITKDELIVGSADIAPPHERMLKPEKVFATLASGGPVRRDSAQIPQFKIGDRVSTKYPNETLFVPDGHTRLPSYAAGKQATIIACHGAHILPNAHAHFLGEAPEPLYQICIDSTALWGDDAEVFDEVVLDCWESYLEVLR